MLNALNTYLLREKSGDKNAKITVLNKALPYPPSVSEIENTADGFIGASIFSIGMAFIPASIISYIVKEREINIKHQ